MNSYLIQVTGGIYNNEVHLQISLKFAELLTLVWAVLWPWEPGLLSYREKIQYLVTTAVKLYRSKW